MPDQDQSLDRRRQAAVQEIARRLVEMGTNPDYAQEAAEAVKDRLFFGGPKAPVRVLTRSSLGEFYPGSFTDPFGALIGEIFGTTSDENRLVAVRQREEAVEELREQKAASGTYSDL